MCIIFRLFLGVWFLCPLPLLAAAEVGEITLWCHAGLCKTGNTAIRPILHQLHDSLKKQGTLVVRENFHDGNNRLAYFLWQDPAWLEKKLRQAQKENCHTVLLYSENLFLDLNPEAFIKKAQGIFPKTRVSFCVRDIYPLFYTLYQEYRKADIVFGDWPHWAAKGKYRGVKELSYFLATDDVPLTLINYDVHRDHMLEALFASVEIPIDWSQTNIPALPQRNRSVALEEWNIMDAFRKQKVGISHPWACTFWKAVEKAFPDRKPFRFYDPEADVALYERYGHFIAAINKRLPDGHQIPSVPHQPHGFTTEWDQSHTSAEDVKLLVPILGIKQLYEKDKNSTYAAQKDAFPPDFDAFAYAAQHLEILPAKEDPFAHYLRNQ